MTPTTKQARTLAQIDAKGLQYTVEADEIDEGFLNVQLDDDNDLVQSDAIYPFLTLHDDGRVGEYAVNQPAMYDDFDALFAAKAA